MTHKSLTSISPWIILFGMLTAPAALAISPISPLSGLFGQDPGVEQAANGRFLPPDDAFSIPYPEISHPDTPISQAVEPSLDNWQQSADEPAKRDRKNSRHAALVIRWQIADGYYLYRDRFRFALQEAPPEVELGCAEIPQGIHKDEGDDFGTVEVLHGEVAVTVPLILRTLPTTAIPGHPITLRISVGYQGCAEAGLCYQPITKNLHVDL
ncbi:MAG: Disulphide bond corrector protein DsbC [Candidatus Kentron sp. G]|nr:MAG: Disulphide bond corrector protein DsbC [Candidatus Kentron sp. G]VFN05057.1 MAG: Disulphide bond corrector protein DsbC [Candidatus Kentron sp. G]VFN06278.1 MAG: Disulphide bond corrector protein DsbC [Candidatus Kentron sp. G]